MTSGDTKTKNSSVSLTDVELELGEVVPEVNWSQLSTLALKHDHRQFIFGAVWLFVAIYQTLICFLEREDRGRTEVDNLFNTLSNRASVNVWKRNSTFCSGRFLFHSSSSVVFMIQQKDSCLLGLGNAPAARSRLTLDARNNFLLV